MSNLSITIAFCSVAILATASSASATSSRLYGPNMVFSDMDDTIVAAGDQSKLLNRMSGVDGSLPKDTLYPGCIEVLASLCPKVIVISAAPHATIEKKQALLDVHYNNILRISDILHPTWCEFLGDFFLPKFKSLCCCRDKTMEEDRFENYATRKINNLERWMSTHQQDLNGVSKRYFFGDNGQGDLLAANCMISKGLIDIAFIRIATEYPVVKIDNDIRPNLCFFNEPRNSDRGKIILFRNYLDVAYALYTLNHLASHQLIPICAKISSLQDNDPYQHFKVDEKAYWSTANTKSDFADLCNPDVNLGYQLREHFAWFETVHNNIYYPTQIQAIQIKERRARSRNRYWRDPERIV